MALDTVDPVNVSCHFDASSVERCDQFFGLRIIDVNLSVSTTHRVFLSILEVVCRVKIVFIIKLLGDFVHYLVGS